MAKKFELTLKVSYEVTQEDLEENYLTSDFAEGLEIDVNNHVKYPYLLEDLVSNHDWDKYGAPEVSGRIVEDS